MKYLCLLALRTVIANKRRSLVNIAVIALSVAMVVITSTFCATLIESQKEAILTSLPADLTAREINSILAQDWGLNLFQGIGAFFNGLMLIIAAFLIYGTFSAGIRERAKLMAVLTTVGAGDVQKAFVSVAEALILSLVGIPFGILIGLPAVSGVCLYLSEVLPLHFSFDLKTLARAVLIGLAAVLLSTLISIVKSMRRSVIGLVKTTSGIEIRLKKSILDLLMWKLFGKAGELALTGFVNQKRNYRFLSLSFAVSMTLYVNLNLVIPYFRQNMMPESPETAAILANGITAVFNVLILLAVLTSALMFCSMFDARKGEFAIYRSIGMDTRTMYQIVALEWLFRGFYLFLFGLFGTYAVDLLLYGLMQTAVEAHTFINPIRQILHALLATAIITTLMTVAMIARLSRLNIVQELKREF